MTGPREVGTVSPSCGPVSPSCDPPVLGRAATTAPSVDSLVWLDQWKWGQSLLAVIHQRWAGLPLQHQVLIHWFCWTKGSGNSHSCDPPVLGRAATTASSVDSLVKHLLTFLLFSSACTDRRHGGTQLSVSSKAGGLEKGHPLSSEGVCHGVAPSFSWSSSRSPAGVLGVVCPEV